MNSPPTISNTRKHRWPVLIPIVAIAALVVFHAPILQGTAAYLITEDPLQRAAAIVALGGEPPFREMEAAKLYREGWAPRVVIVRGVRREELKAFQDMGIEVAQRWELSREVLIQQGVPASAILVPEEEAGSW